MVIIGCHFDRWFFSGLLLSPIDSVLSSSCLALSLPCAYLALCLSSCLVLVLPLSCFALFCVCFVKDLSRLALVSSCPCFAFVLSCFGFALFLIKAHYNPCPLLLW